MSNSYLNSCHGFTYHDLCLNSELKSVVTSGVLWFLACMFNMANDIFSANIIVKFVFCLFVCLFVVVVVVVVLALCV